MIEEVTGRKMELGLPGLPNTVKTERTGTEESAVIDVTAACQGQPSRIPFRSEKHSQTVLEGFAELRRNSELFDVTICVGSRRIQAHKAVLASSSVYFRGMFCGELSESRQREVTIHGIDEQAMETLVNYCYSAEIVIEESNVQQLLPAACLLQLSEVQQSCSEFLKQQLDPSNVLGIRSFADTHACHDLMAVADRYALQNFTDVCASEEFLLLPKEQLVSLLRSDELNAHSEEQVYCAVMRWVRSSLSDRRAQVGEVMSEVRLALLAPKFLVETVSVDPIIKRDDVCRDLVDEAKNYLLLADERARLDNCRTRPRKPARSNDILFAVGGWCSGDAINTVERYDEASGEWRMVTPMAKRRCGVGIAVLGDLLYAIGGHDGHSYLHTIERYDTRTNKWDSAADAGASPSGSLGVAPTSTSRTSVGVAVLEGHIYAVGGQDGVSCLNLVERYDPVANRWHKVAPMSTRRLGVGVVAHERVLYAIGGSDGTTPLSSVERYDPRVGRWQAAPAMNTRRKHLGVAVFDGCLFAVGGRDDTIELASAERFDVRAGLWQPVVSMTCRRSGVGLAVCNDRLLAIGGFDGTTYLKSVEQLDADASCWKHHSNMNYRRLGGGVGVVRGVQLNSIDPFGTPITVPHAHLAASASAAPLGS